MGRGAKAVEAEAAAGGGAGSGGAAGRLPAVSPGHDPRQPERAVADDAGAQQRRRREVAQILVERVAEGRRRHHELGVAAVDVPAREASVVAEVLVAAPADSGRCRRSSEPGHPDAVAERMFGHALADARRPCPRSGVRARPATCAAAARPRRRAGRCGTRRRRSPRSGSRRGRGAAGELDELQRPLVDRLGLTQQHGSHGDLRRWLLESYPRRHDYVRCPCARRRPTPPAAGPPSSPRSPPAPDGSGASRSARGTGSRTPGDSSSTV